MHIYFPFEPLLSLLTREQMTDEIRAELRKLQAYFAPTPRGTTDERAQNIQEQIADLIRAAGEKWVEPGRGPWSQIVFDEVKTKCDITRVVWEGLLEHCRTLDSWP